MNHSTFTHTGVLSVKIKELAHLSASCCHGRLRTICIDGQCGRNFFVFADLQFSR